MPIRFTDEMLASATGMTTTELMQTFERMKIEQMLETLPDPAEKSAWALNLGITDGMKRLTDSIPDGDPNKARILGITTSGHTSSRP
jgi:hypothetical protein